MKILVATEKPFAAVAVDGIRNICEEAGHELVLLEKYTAQEELLAAVADVEAMIIRSDKATKEVIEAAKKLKVIVRAGAGYDNIDLAACTEKGVVAMNTPGQNSNAVAELAIGMMIYMARGQFTPGTGTELCGKTLGIQGFGNIGQLVAKKAVGLGMKVVVLAPNPGEKHKGWELIADIKDLYAKCDYISINIPATAETKGILNYDLMSRLPKGATVINTARKELLNEAELDRILSERKDLKYATDVAPDTYAELKEKYGLQVYATPKKQGAQTSEANINAGFAAARQIVEYFATGKAEFQVNK